MMAVLIALFEVGNDVARSPLCGTEKSLTVGIEGSGM